MALSGHKFHWNTASTLTMMPCYWDFEILIESKSSYQQSWAKYLEQNREIQKNWTGKEKSDIYLYMFFDCYCQSCISGRETGHWVIFPPKSEHFLIFPYILRFWVFSHSATCEATCIYTKFAIVDITFHFTCG